MVDQDLQRASCAERETACGAETLSGATLLDISPRAEVVALLFDGNRLIAVRLDEAAWNGPEAMVVEGPGPTTVVWN